MKVYCIVRETQDRDSYSCDVLGDIYFLKDKAQREVEGLNKQTGEEDYAIVEKEIIE